MAKRGGRRSTTWAKNKRPPVQKPKGRKNNKTLIKEALGLKGWEQLKDFVEGKGAEKMVTEMKKLKGKSYVYAMQSIAEFVKPKLSRVDANVKAKVTDLSKIPIVFE